MESESNAKVALVADDQPMMLRLCQAILADMGYTVHKATSGEEGLRFLNDHGAGISLLLTDIVMSSDQDGLELANEAMKNHPHIRIIYMSGYAYGGSISDLLSNPETLFLQKPFVVTSLSDMVKRAEDSTPAH